MKITNNKDPSILVKDELSMTSNSYHQRPHVTSHSQALKTQANAWLKDPITFTRFKIIIKNKVKRHDQVM